MVWGLMRGAGLGGAAITRGLDAFFAAYLEELRRAIGDGSRVQVMPGIAAVVSALAARDDALVGLLTGNIEAGARPELPPARPLPPLRVGGLRSGDNGPPGAAAPRPRPRAGVGRPRVPVRAR